jgi:hypothetical protein
MWWYWLTAFSAFLAELLYKFHWLKLVEYGKFRLEFETPAKKLEKPKKQPKVQKSRDREGSMCHCLSTLSEFI